MLYGSPISYNEPQYSYIGNLYIYVPGNENPIIVPNVTIFYALNEDYSNLTTISVISIELQSNGIIVVIAENEDYSALLSAEILYTDGASQILVA